MTEPQNLKEKIDEIQKEVKEIRDALLGNEFNNKEGIVGNLHDHEQRLVILEIDRIRSKAYIAAFVSLGGFVTLVLKALFDHYFK